MKILWIFFRIITKLDYFLWGGGGGFLCVLVLFQKVKVPNENVLGGC